MSIIDFFSRFIKNNRVDKIRADIDEKSYKKLLKHPKVETILNSVPKKLDELERAYYVYVKLGEILSEDPAFAFVSRFGKESIYQSEMSDKLEGICRSFAGIYIQMLKDPRVNVSADAVKQLPNYDMSHVDVIINANGKHYVTNISGDLAKIKTSRRVTSFGHNLSVSLHNKAEEDVNKEHLNRLTKIYGKISHLTSQDIEKMDMKLGFSYGRINTAKGVRGVYGNDTSDLLKKDFNDPAIVKEIILGGRNVPKELLLEHKLEYLFENNDKLTTYQGKVDYLDNVRYFRYLFKKILSPEEFERIKVYVVRRGKNVRNLDAILKIMPQDKTSKYAKNYYYKYSSEDRTFIKQTDREMIDLFDELRKDKSTIVGEYDEYSGEENGELER